jgi:hypothetical protein
MWILKISILLNYAAFIVGCIQYKYFTKEIKIIFYFVSFGVLTEIFTKFYQFFWMKNTMPIGHFYFPASTLILGLFYLHVLRNFVRPVYILTILIAFIIYSLINSIFIQGLFEYASLVASIGALIVFIFSVAFFTKIMVDAKITKLSAEPLVWINSVLLFYFAGNFFYYSLYNLRLLASMETALLAIKFFGVLNLILYVVIAISFLMAKNKPTKHLHN